MVGNDGNMGEYIYGCKCVTLDKWSDFTLTPPLIAEYSLGNCKFLTLHYFSFSHGLSAVTGAVSQ